MEAEHVGHLQIALHRVGPQFKTVDACATCIRNVIAARTFHDQIVLSISTRCCASSKAGWIETTSTTGQARWMFSTYGSLG